MSEPTIVEETNEQLAERVIEHIGHLGGGVSFVEIQAFLSKYIEVAGDIGMVLPEAPMVVLWAGMSQRFFDVMRVVQASGKVEPTSAHLLVYLVDGKALTYPLAKATTKARLQAYKREHWAPVTFALKRTKQRAQR